MSCDGKGVKRWGVRGGVSREGCEGVECEGRGVKGGACEAYFVMAVIAFDGSLSPRIFDEADI